MSQTKVAGVNFPPEAQAIAAAWKNRGIVMTMTASPLPAPGACQNCNGGGFVALRLLIGSFAYSPSAKHKPVAWVDGYWRVVEGAVEYVCPDCKGKGLLAQPARRTSPKEAQKAVENLAERLDYTDV